jgi:hypothetical protein
MFSANSANLLFFKLQIVLTGTISEHQKILRP